MLIFIDDGEDDDSEFFKALDGSDRSQVSTAEEGGDDNDFEKNTAAHVHLYR